MVAILNFMYKGEVNVNQEDLQMFLAAAEELRIKGLSQVVSSILIISGSGRIGIILPDPLPIKKKLRIYLIKLKTFRGICTLLKYRIIKNALTVCVVLRYVESGSVIFWYPNTGFKCGSGLTPKWSESWFLKVRSAILLYILPGIPAIYGFI